MTTTMNVLLYLFKTLQCVTVTLIAYRCLYGDEIKLSDVNLRFSVAIPVKHWLRFIAKKDYLHVKSEDDHLVSLNQ